MTAIRQRNTFGTTVRAQPVWRKQMNQDDHPGPDEGMFVTLFLVVSDQDRSRNFYQTVFGGKILREREGPQRLQTIGRISLVKRYSAQTTVRDGNAVLRTPADSGRFTAQSATLVVARSAATRAPAGARSRPTAARGGSAGTGSPLYDHPASRLIRR
jgi:hypothetical protein